jgi:hypothetical protein
MGYDSFWQTLAGKISCKIMNYHETNHGREETAGKPQNENSAAANGKRSRPNRSRSSSSRANCISAVPKTPGQESAKPAAGSKKAEVQEVLNAISGCTGIPLEILLRKPNTPHNRSGSIDASANRKTGAPREIIGRKEVAQRLGKSLRTICYWMADGSLPYRKFKGSVLFEWDKVKAAVLDVKEGRDLQQKRAKGKEGKIRDR